MKQDMNGVRTAQDLEQKYNLGAIDEIKKETQKNAEQITSTNNELKDFTTQVTKDLGELQDQIDGNIMTWFLSGVPTLSTPPANEWVTDEEKNNHLGDLYYDKDTGYAYRFTLENGVYSWLKLTDSDVTEALALANSAKDTADSKRRVFLEQPIPPYDNGDMWIKNNEIYICQISKSAGQTFAENDFINNLKYTDDTYAIQVGENLTVLSGTVLEIKNDVDEHTTKITQTQELVDEQGEQIGVLGQQYTELQQTTSGLTITVGQTTTNLNNLESTVNNQTSQIGSLNTQMQSTNQNVSSLQGTVNSQSSEISNLSGQIENTNQNVSTLQGTVSGQATEISNLNTQVESANENISSMQSTINTQNTQISSLNGQVETTNQNVNNLTGTVNTQAGQISNLSGQITTVNENINTVQNTVSEQNESIGHLQDDYSQLEQSTNELNTAVIENQNNIASQQTDISNLNSDLSTTNSELNQVKNDLSTANSTINEMKYTFTTDELKIQSTNDPINSALDNQGIRVYNYATLKSVLNDKGSGFDDLIVTNTAQIGYLKFVKATDENNEPVTDIHHLVSNIQNVEDLL